MEQMRFDLGFCKNSKIKVILHVYYLLDIIFLIWISKILLFLLTVFSSYWFMSCNTFCIWFLFQKCVLHILPSTLGLTFHSLNSDFKQHWKKFFSHTFMLITISLASFICLFSLESLEMLSFCDGYCLWWKVRHHSQWCFPECNISISPEY